MKKDTRDSDPRILRYKNDKTEHAKANCSIQFTCRAEFRGEKINSALQVEIAAEDSEDGEKKAMKQTRTGELEHWTIYDVGREAGPTAGRGVRVARRNELASSSATI